MGKYYQTAKPTFVDNVIYQAPYDLMLNALNSQDKAFNEQKKELDAFDTMGDLLDFVDKDKDKRNQILDLHRGKANEIAEKIQKNPALYQNYIGEINRAKKDFQTDVTSGGLFEMDRAAKRRTALRKQIQDNKNISEEARDQALQTIDREYKGQGEGDFSEDIHIYDKIDEAEFQKELKAVINVDVEGSSTTVPKNGYLITDGETKSYLSDERLKAIVDSDPTMDKWKREQLQTLTRALENGQFENQAQMEAEYKRRLEAFKDNTIEKLGFQKVSSEQNVSSDGTEMAKRRLALDWTKYNDQKKKEEAALSSYKVELNGTFNNLSDSTINDLYGPAQVDLPTINPAGAYGGTYGGGKRELSVAEKRQALETEKKVLTDKLTKFGMTNADFREKMMTFEGRIGLAETLNMSKEQLARQANYDKTYSFETVTSPKDNGKNIIENTKYHNVVTEAFNTLPPNEKVSIQIIDSEGNVETSQNMTLGEAFEKGYVQGQTSAQTVKDLVPYLGGYKSVDGTIVMMPDPNNPDKQVIATKEYAIESGQAESKESQVDKFDATKPLLHIQGNQVSQSKKRNYGDGKTKATEKEVYNVHTSKMIDGDLKTIVITKDLKINEL